MTSKTVRLARGTKKLVNVLLWKALAARLAPPQIELVYDNQGQIYRLNEPGFVEPNSGYVITRKGVLIEDSMRPNFKYSKRPFRIEAPSLPHFRMVLRNHSRWVSVETTVSARHFWEWNYYHFFLDVLGFLHLADLAGFLKNEYPISAAKYLDDVKFARQVIQQPGFSAYQWLAPTDAFIAAQTVYYGQTQTNYKDRIEYINQQMRLPSVVSQEKRIFLTRSGNRRITNMDQIKPVLDRYKFEIVDTEGMSVVQQATLFSQTAYLIAIHGAGTTNIIFRGNNKLNLLELHSDRCMNFDHKRIAVELGNYWDSLEGKSNHAQPWNLADFCIAPEPLEEKIISLLAA